MIPYIDHGDVSQLPRLNDIDRLPVVLHAVLLGSDLDDAVVFISGFDEEASLGDRITQGFFEIDIFSRLAGGDGDRHMPMRLGGDDDRVDTLVFEQLSKIVIGRYAIPAGSLLSSFEMFGVDVAYRRHSDAGQRHEARHDLIGPAGATTDQSEMDCIVRFRFPRRPLPRRGLLPPRRWRSPPQCFPEIDAAWTHVFPP